MLLVPVGVGRAVLVGVGGSESEGLSDKEIDEVPALRVQLRVFVMDCEGVGVGGGVREAVLVGVGGGVTSMVLVAVAVGGGLTDRDIVKVVEYDSDSLKESDGVGGGVRVGGGMSDPDGEAVGDFVDDWVGLSGGIGKG